MSKTSQCQKIIEYCRQHGSITQLEAISCLGIMRLASRINDLKNSGYKIKSEMVRGINRDGERISWARYRLEEKANETNA